MDNNFWKERSRNYSKLQWVSDNKFLNFFIDKCGDSKKKLSMLDIGTGTGIIPFGFAQSNFKIVGIDTSDAMIKKALKNLSSQNSSISFLKMDAQQLDFADEQFDAVTIRMALHHIQDTEKALKEAYRVLKFGGFIVICEGLAPDHHVLEMHRRIFRFKENRYIFSEAELINYFDRTGFRNIELWPYFMRRMSLRKWISQSTIESKNRDMIYKLYRNANKYFKKAYNIVETQDDILMDWKFTILRARK